MAAHLGHADLERDASAKRGLLEEHEKSLATHDIGIALRMCLEICALCQDCKELLLAQVSDLQDVTNHFFFELLLLLVTAVH